MYLSAMRLHGFKSFATVTQLRFRPGLTAIVGPNGSGKSNVADALRWALGEQSIRALRGTRSQDVIFSGNGQRRPLGFAEVSIVLDNSDGALPVGFSEVAISRRVYQTGEGEFAINGAACRLRDIHELLTDTGLGRGGFFVISQGEIDAVLSAKAEDRRLLIEEAARTAGYRIRKRQTLERLEAARADRRRVMDLLEELHRQAEELEVQAAQARRYRQLREQLHRVEGQLVLAAWRRLARAWEAGAARLRELRDQVRRSEETLAAEEAAYRSWADRREQDEGALARAREAVDGHRQALAASRHRLELAGVRLAQLDQEEAALRARLEELAAQLQEEERERHEAAAALQRVQEEAAALAQKVAAGHREYAEGEKALAEAEAALERLRAQWMARQQELAAHGAAARALEDRQRALQQQRERLQAELEELAAERRQVETELGQARGRLEALEQESRQLQAGLEAARSRLAAQEKAVAAANGRLAALEKGQQADAVRRRALEAMEEGQEGYHAGVRAVMRARGRLGPGIIGPVGQLLEVDKRWQAAMEVALGGAIQHIVTGDDAAAQAAIAYLKEKRLGRATFLPLNLLRVSPPPAQVQEVLEEKGVFGLANALVGAPAEVQRAVDYLLGRTLVVETLPLAIGISRRLPPSVRLVTLDGEMVNPGGAVSGGAFGKNQGRELLARRAALKELAEAMAAREAALAQLREQAAAAEAERKRLERAVQEGMARQQRLQGEAAALRRRVVELEAMQERLGRRWQRVEEDVAKGGEEAASVASEGEGLARERLRLEAEVQQLQRQVEAQGEAVAEGRRRLQGGIPGLNAAQARLAALQQQEIHLGGLLKRHQGAEERLKRQHLEAETRLQELARQRGQLQQQQEAERGQASAIANALEAAEQRLQEVVEAAEGSRREVRRREGAVEQARREADRWRQALHRQETEWQRLEHERGALRERAESLGMLWVEGEGPQPVPPAPGDPSGEGYAGGGDGPQPVAAGAAEDPAEGADPAPLQREAARLRRELEAMPPVNLAAPGQLAQLRARIEDIEAQAADLEEAEAALREAVAEIDAVAAETFLDVLGRIQEALHDVFGELFPGGECRLSPTDPDDPLSGGVEIHVQLPGKPSRHLMALSGGERALTAIALMFSIMRVRPAPFCVLDEVDAPLDEANLQRFTRLLRATADRTQVIAITHRRPTMEIADHLYGVTMREAGVSSLVSLDLKEVG